MESVKTKKNEIILLAIIFSIFLGIIFSKNINSSYGIEIINDEFGYWGIAASLSGLDWSELLSNTPYYSFGYSIIIALLFKLSSSPQQLYQYALLINVTLVIGSFFLSYSCGKYIFKDISKKIILILSFITALYINNVVQAQLAWTETILYFLYWLLLFLIIKIVECPKSFTIFAFSFINIYIYFVHQRAIGILLSSILVILFLILKRRLSKKQIIIFFFTLVIGYLIGSTIKNNLTNNIFLNKELVMMNDYEGQVSKIKSIFGSWTGFCILLESILGKLFYVGAATFLLGFFALKELCYNVIKSFFSMFIGGVLENKIIIYCYIVLSFSAMFLISAISMYNPAGRFDLLVYGRYMEFTIGPLILIGLALVYKKKVGFKEGLIYIVILICLGELVNEVFVSLKNASFNETCATMLAYFVRNMDGINGLAFWVVLFVIAVFLIVLTLSYKKRCVNLVCIILPGIFWVYLSGYLGINDLQRNIKNDIGGIVATLQNLEETHSISVVKNSDRDDVYSKYIQYHLNDCIVNLVEMDDVYLDSDEDSVFLVCYDDEIMADIVGEYTILEKNSTILAFTQKENVKLISDWNEQRVKIKEM